MAESVERARVHVTIGAVVTELPPAYEESAADLNFLRSPVNLSLWFRRIGHFSECLCDVTTGRLCMILCYCR